MPILTMAIADSKVPKILNLCEVLDHEKVVLVSLGDAIRCLAWSSQICKHGDLVIDFADRLLRLGWLCLCYLVGSRLAIRMSVLSGI